MSGGNEFIYKVGADLSQLKSEAAAGTRALKSIDDQVRKTSEGMGAMSRLSADLEKALSFGGLGVGALTVAGVVSQIRDLAGSMVEAQVAADRLRVQFTAAFGGTQAGNEIAFVRKAADDLGLAMAETAQGYAKFAASTKGTSLEGAKTRQIFGDMALAMKSLHLSTAESEAVFGALTQMVSKGTVQSEELRGQLGDRLPGAMAAAARSMGVTTAELSKMLEQGQVISNDFLPRFAEQLRRDLGGAAEESAKSMESSLNRVSNAWNQLKQTAVSGGIGESIAGSIDQSSRGLGALEEILGRASERGKGLLGTLADIYVTSAQIAMVKMTGSIDALGDLASKPKLLALMSAQATEELKKLQAQADAAGGGGMFLRSELANAQALVDKLKAVQGQMAAAAEVARGYAESDAHIVRQAGELRAAEEARGRRLSALNGIISKLNGEQTEYAKNLKALKDSYAAGDFAGREAEYQRLLAANAKLKPKDKGEAALETERDQILRRTLEGRIKAQQDFAAKMKAAYDFARAYEDGVYQSGVLSLQNYTADTKRLRADELASTLKAFDAEIAALKDYQSKARRPQDRIDAENKIAEVMAKRTKATEDAGRADILAAQQADAALASTRQRVAEITAQIRDLQGDSLGASLLRITQQSEDARKALTQAGQGGDRADQLQAVAEWRAHLVDLQRRYGELTQDAAANEEALNAAATRTGTGLLEQERQIGQARQLTLAQLRELIDATAALNDENQNPEGMRFLAELRRQYAALQDAVDPTLKRLADAGRQAGQDIASAFADSIMQGEKLSDTLKNLLQIILRIGVQELFTKPAGQALGGLFASWAGSSAAGGTSAPNAAGGFSTAAGINGGRAIGGVAGKYGASTELAAVDKSGRTAAGGGEPSIVQHMTFNGGADPQQLAAWGEQIKAQTKAEIMRSKQTGGAFA